MTHKKEKNDDTPRAWISLWRPMKNVLQSPIKTFFNYKFKIKNFCHRKSEPCSGSGDPKNIGSTVKTTKLILLDSLLQEVVVTLPHLVLQKPSTAKMREAPTGAGTDTG
jgi:hypothetical protein